jgi:Uncharacterized ACR, COG1993
VVEVVDRDENIRRVLPILDDMVADGLVTLERVVITYRAGNPPESRRNNQVCDLLVRAYPRRR